MLTLAKVHPTAILRGEIHLAEDVEIGPYCVLTGGGEGGGRGEPGAGAIRVGPGVRFLAGAHLLGPVEIGAGTIVHPHACLGFRAQDLKFAPGAPTAGVVIGENCQIREHVTIHAATNDHTPTRIGDRAFMMVSTHVGHDSSLGSDVTMVNGAMVAGHVHIGDRVILSGLSAIHQHTRVGRMVMVAGLSGASQDVPPCCIADGFNGLGGVNLVGLRRAGVSRDEITQVREAYRRALRRRLPRADTIAILEEFGAGSPLVAEMARFVAGATRGFCSGSPTRRLRPPRIEAPV
jgi:UDP-N-acetylglucosamine acyltransferase